VAEALDAIERSAENQSRLVEDLLDVSRIAAGKLRLEPLPTPFDRIVSEVAGSMRPAMIAKRLRCSVDIDPRVGVVRCDARRLQQVISNLLSNAVKFTPPEGEITVRVRREDDFVEIVVADTGAGIDREFLPRLFDRFAQAGGSRDRTQSGLGLGLNIVKNIVELHGGVVFGDSGGPGRGSVFTVRLPLPIEESDAGAPATAPPVSGLAGRLAGRRVLLVEDQPDAAAVIALTLHRAGAEVAHAASGRQGLNLLESARPDVIVSDIGMPDMNGFDFLRQVRIMEARMERPPAAALALTAFGGGEVARRAAEAGYDAFLVKPTEPGWLVTEIARLAGAGGQDVHL
jgi:CheY-like chemotaxis protein